MTTRYFHLACYDVSDQRRLHEALKIVRQYARGGQKSVHEVLLSETEKRQVLEELSYLLDLDTDRFLLVSLDPRSRITTLGKAIAPFEQDYFYIG
ncbi:MAG: hypothetical protein ACFCUG_06785 [Thiotrichales bacterium]